MAKITGKQIAKSIVMTLIGAAPGTLWFFNAGKTQSIVIASLGAFVAFCLSLPGVSAARVAGGTAGMIIARNAPRSMQGEILNAFVGGNESQDHESDSGANANSDSQQA